MIGRDRQSLLEAGDALVLGLFLAYYDSLSCAFNFYALFSLFVVFFNKDKKVGIISFRDNQCLQFCYTSTQSFSYIHMHMTIQQTFSCRGKNAQVPYP